MSVKTLPYWLLCCLILVACSEKKQVTKATAKPVCSFPFSQEAAPQWICSQSDPNSSVSAVGSAEYNAAGYSYMLDLATADARGKMAEQMQTEVDKMVKSYFGTTGIQNQQTIDRATESVLKTLSSQTLRGSRTINTVTDQQKRLYVLVGMNEQAFKDSTQQAVQSSINNDNALWQQFKAKQGFDELAKEIANQPR